MTNQEILKIAMAQSARDLSADASDFEKSENVVVTSSVSYGARRYLKLPFFCQLVSYGNNVVASVSPEFREIADRAEKELHDKDQLILVYCRSGRRSKIAAEELVKLGYTNVKEFGGIIDWEYEIVK